MKRTAAKPPTCPRCAYDQSGAVATWTDSCPLQGTCSECGLTFDWCEVLRPDARRVRWLYEHSRGLGLLALIRSLWMAIIPARFWSRVSLSHQISRHRLLLMVILATLLMHTTTVINRFVCYSLYIRATATGYRGGGPATLSWLETWAVVTGGSDPLTITVAMALPFATVDTDQDVLQGAVFGLIRLPSRALLALHVFVALMILALPDTRAIAKVRPVHLLRAAAYPTTLVIVLFYAGVIVEQWSEYVTNTSGRWWWEPPVWTDIIALPVGIGWAAWWWFCVCRAYLKLPNPILIWFVAFGVGFFATVVIGLSAVLFIVGPLLSSS